MSRPHLLLALALGLPSLGLAAETAKPAPAPSPAPAGKAAPATKENDSDAEIILLTGLPAGKAPEVVSSYARKTYVKAELVKDPLLRQFVQFALSKIEDQPEKALQIRQEHLSKLADFFLERAMEAQAADKPNETLRLAEIAVRCNPANPKAKLFYANFLHGKMGRTDDAIQTMRHGLEFLDINDKLGRDYLERYFQFLQLRERDAEVIDQGLKLLRVGKDLPQATREAIALATATSQYWTGKYPDCVKTITINSLDSLPNGLLLKAKALFDGGKTQEGLSLLETKGAAIKDYTPRDAILSQQARFHVLLGQTRMALSVNEDRISLNEKAPFPHIQRLQLLDKLGLKDEYEKELLTIKNKFETNSAAMIALANFAAEKGYDGLTAALTGVAAARGFESATFAALHLEALLNAGLPDQVIAQHQQVSAADPAFFHSNRPLIQALLGIAHYARNKPDEATAKRERDIGDRYLAEFLKSKDLGPEAYRSVGRHLRAIRASEAAVRILEAGVQVHPTHSQLRADYVRARLLAGLTDAYGTRKSMLEELEHLQTLRRPSPLVWQEALSWLRSEAKLTAAQSRQLEASLLTLIRPGLDTAALEGR
ncbi:MAG: hypothetical protein RLZZ550_329 [Verrucomicrobiota bacterium]|jgi:hypothetical protein